MNHVFTPFQWGKMTLSNRLVMAPMCMYSANEEGDVQPFHLAHYTARAYGGVGLVIVEATAVEARGRISINDLGIYADQHLAGLHQLVAMYMLQGHPLRFNSPMQDEKVVIFLNQVSHRVPFLLP